MKRSLFIVVLIFVFFSLNALYRDLDLPPAPFYEFSTPPVDLGGTIYDYMPGSYCSLPIRIQPDQIDSGVPAGGAYIAFHSRISSSSKRRVNYAYIDPNGNLVASGAIGLQDIWEGYPGIDIDPVTGNPFVTYQVNVDNSRMTNNNFTYDQYNLAGIPGLWLIPPFTLSNSVIHPEHGAIRNRDQFMRPYVYIGASPINSKRRVYITANNATKSANGYPSENVLLAYADFDENDILNLNPESWNWQYRTIRQFDNWHNEILKWARPFKTFAVKDNYVVYIGELIFNRSGMESSSKLFALVNDNYGEGDFRYYEFDYQNEWQINDVQKTDGSWLYGYDNLPAQLRWRLFASEHFNAIFSSDNTISFPGALMLEYYDVEEGEWLYKARLGHAMVKEFTFNIQTGEFGVEDVYPPDFSYMPNSTPVVPWDLDGDGDVDYFDNNGCPTSVPSLPVFYSDMDKSSDYSSFYITKSEDNSMEAIVWNDCYEAYLQANGEEEYDDWANISKIMIATKMYDTWRTPIIINAKEGDENYNAAIQNMIPCYVYPADKIVFENNCTMRLSLFFLNDDSYGSYILSDGAAPNPDNCKLEYAAIDISSLANEQNQISHLNPLEISNYPNPFNPQTTIKYNLPENGNVRLEVFNLKGQKVKTLVNKIQKSGEHSIVWDGKDDNARNLTSGIYFYKIKQGKFTSTKKMILMK